MASVKRATWRIWSTSWIRNMSAPFWIATATDAAVPNNLSCASAPNTFPIKDFLDVPTKIG